MRVVRKWVRKGQEYFTVDKLVQVDVYQASREGMSEKYFARCQERVKVKKEEEKVKAEGLYAR